MGPKTLMVLGGQQGLAGQILLRTERVRSICAAELQADPERLSSRWAQIAQLELQSDSAGNPTIEFDNAPIPL